MNILMLGKGRGKRRLYYPPDSKEAEKKKIMSVAERYYKWILNKNTDDETEDPVKWMTKHYLEKHNIPDKLGVKVYNPLDHNDMPYSFIFGRWERKCICDLCGEEHDYFDYASY